MKNRLRLTFLLVSMGFALGVHAEDMTLTYNFYGTAEQQPYAYGAKLRVEIDGTVQADGDTVLVNSISSATLERVGLPAYDFPSIETDNIETVPPGGNPTVSFSGGEINFTACPSGFTTDTDGDGSNDNCNYHVDGGFGITRSFSDADNGTAFAGDDTGTTNCENSGCPVTDPWMDVGYWILDSDSDSDGASDEIDNCADVANFQLDLNGFADGDGVGDACEIGDTQNFSDNSRPIRTSVWNFVPTSCAVNGWRVYDCANAVVDGAKGPRDKALRFSSTNSSNKNFHLLTWEEYAHADTRFLGDYLDAKVTRLSFRARHAGGTDDLVLRVMLTDTFDDGGTDFAITNQSILIPAGSGWAKYTIWLDINDLTLGTKLFGEKSPGPPRRTAEEILGAVAQFGLRHDPNGTGPGTKAPTDAILEIDDIQLKRIGGPNGGGRPQGVGDRAGRW